MTFAVLAGIGTAIGNVAGAVAASALPAAIGGGAAGAGGIGAMTAGSVLAGTGLGAAGTAAAAPTAGAMAAEIGKDIALGSATGSAMSAATGGDPGQGALMGAVTGGVTGGMGALGGGAGSAGQAASQAGQAGQTAAQAAQASAPAAQAATGAGSVGSAGKGFFDFVLNTDVAKAIGSELASTGITSSIEGLQRASASGAANKDMDLATASNTQEREDIKDRAGGMYAPNTLGGGKGLGWASGGQIALKEGQFIIPADVVSALGNGSTKAGARFLDDFFAAG
jgi:hypothetical protein